MPTEHESDRRGAAWRLRRRRENVAGGRQHQHKVLVTPEEEAVLGRLAAARHVTIPRLLVEAATRGIESSAPSRAETVEALWTVQRVLAGVANNLNQLARAHNAGVDVPEAELRAVLAKIRELGLRIDKAVERL